MNEVNRTEQARPVVGGNVRVEAEGGRETESTAANVRQPGGSASPVVVQEVTSENRSAETARAMRAQVEAAVASLNEYARSYQRNLEFSVDSELGRPVVQVIDASTREVIRQIPSETVLSVARNLQASIERLDLQRAAQHAGVDSFVSADVSLGLVNTRA